MADEDWQEWEVEARQPSVNARRARSLFGPASSMADVAQHGAGVLNPLLDSGSNALGQGALADILRSAPDLPSDAPAGLRPAPPAAARKSSYSLPGFPDGQVRGSSLSGSIKDGPLSRDNSMSGSLPALLPVPRSRSSALLAEGNSRGSPAGRPSVLSSGRPVQRIGSTDTSGTALSIQHSHDPDPQDPADDDAYYFAISPKATMSLVDGLTAMSRTSFAPLGCKLYHTPPTRQSSHSSTGAAGPSEARTVSFSGPPSALSPMGSRHRLGQRSRTSHELPTDDPTSPEAQRRSLEDPHLADADLAAPMLRSGSMSQLGTRPDRARALYVQTDALVLSPSARAALARSKTGDPTTDGGRGTFAPQQQPSAPMGSGMYSALGKQRSSSLPGLESIGEQGNEREGAQSRRGRGASSKHASRLAQ